MAKILIVDDDREFLENMTNILEDAGYSYIATADSGSVSKKIRSYRPHLIILDIYLNQDNGVDIAKDLKETYDTQSIPLVLISCSNKVKEMSEKVYAEGYLRKPFSQKELTQIVSNLVIKRQNFSLL